MIVPVYAPGDWYAVITDGRVALLPPTTPVAVVHEVWASLREGAGLTEQLQLLLRQGLAGLPPFALVSVEGGQVHAVVRGDVEVEVGTSEGVRLVSGPLVSTWSEEIVAHAQTVVVRTPGAGDAASVGELPVLSGVVRAAGVGVEMRAGTRAAPQPARQEPVGRATAGGEVAEPPPVVAPADDGLDDLEHTLMQPPAAPATAPVTPTQRPHTQPTGPPAAPASPSAQPVGTTGHPVPEPLDAELTGLLPPLVPVGEDHDGMTVLSSDVVALRRQLPDWAGDAVPGPLAVPAPRTPPPAKLLLSSGLVVALNRPVLLGRAPQVSRVANRELPRLVTVASPNQDISRTHAEVRMDGEDVLVTDLRSTNGVLVLRPGKGAQRLHPGEPTVVEPHVIVDLGEGVTFMVERGA
ncbi:FHA domain-containing protein [Actinotalea sp. K2]|uniref:FHA domain-containing protein n=1 Tax=Actinotalea sp. K2 TaxID=2939438 RepID=UPI002016A99A|nr:FHA domain-containing protein [Actinotalea sp. K2]MCL3863205.1 FHA domain-containing protein [Actinotalea sp. K2]